MSNAVQGKRRPDEEVHRDVLLAQRGDQQAATRVCRSVAALVESLAGKATSRTHLRADLRQAGWEGCLYAIKTWNPRGQAKFTVWAYHYIWGYIRNDSRVGGLVSGLSRKDT